jgi:hypothetical protein
MNITRTLCDYCGKPREFTAGWHACRQAQAARQRMKTAISGIEAIATHQPRTSERWNPHRAQRFQDLATSIKISGGEIRQEI